MRPTPRARYATTTLLVVLLCSQARSARADYIFTPFVGGTFAGSTAFLDLEGGSGSKHVIFGGSGGWLGSGVFGVEGDVAYAPRFFEGEGDTIIASTAFTLTGNVIVATPLGVSGYSLRPYLVGGLGLIHSGITYQDVVPPVDDNSLGMNLGAGAIGMLSQRTGLRFEVRYLRTFSRQEHPLTGELAPRLSFWRATIGVLIRR